MKKSYFAKIKDIQFPVVVTRGEDGWYIVECVLFTGCYSQGKTIDEALENIKDAISLCLEEEDNREILKTYKPKELSLHTVTL